MTAHAQGTTNLLALESHVILSLQLGLGVSLTPVTDPALVDNVRLGQYVEMRDMLMIYMPWASYIFWGSTCTIRLACRQPSFDPLFKWDSWCRVNWWIRWVTVRHFVGM